MESHRICYAVGIDCAKEKKSKEKTGCVLCNLFFSLLEIYHTFHAQVTKMVDKLEINHIIEANVT